MSAGLGKVITPFSGNSAWLRVVFVFFLVGMGGDLDAQTDSVEVLENRYIILQLPGKPAQLLAAEKVEISELVVKASLKDGKASAWQKSFVLGNVPMEPEMLDGVGDEEIQEIISQFEAIQQPDVRAELQSKATALKAELERRKQEAATKASEAEKQVGEFLGVPFDPEKDYTAEEIGDKIVRGEGLAGEFPGYEEKITAYLAPLKEYKQNLDEGKVRQEGRWMTPEEIKAEREAKLKAAEEKFFNEEIKLQFPQQMIPQLSMILVVVFMALSVGLVLYVFLNLLKSDSINVMGVIMLLLCLGLVGLYGYYGSMLMGGAKTIEEFLPPSVVDGSKLSSTGVGRMLFLCSSAKDKRFDDGDMLLTIQDGDVNALLKDKVAFTSNGQPELLEVDHERLAVQFSADKIVILDQVVWLGGNMLFRYELNQRVTDQAVEFSGFRVYLGNCELPQRLASHVWRIFSPQLFGFVELSGIGKYYRPETIESGKVVMKFLFEKKAEMEEGKPPSDDGGTKAPTEDGSE